MSSTALCAGAKIQYCLVTRNLEFSGVAQYTRTSALKCYKCWNRMFRATEEEGPRFPRLKLRLRIMAHTFNPSTWETRMADLSEFKASFVYIISSRPARDIW